MGDLSVRVGGRRLPGPAVFLGGYAALVLALGAFMLWLPLPVPVLLFLAIPIPFLPLFYPRPVYLIALAMLVAVGAPLAYLLHPDFSFTLRRMAAESLALIGVTELIRHVVGQRTRALEALRASEERYRLLLETTQVVPWECDLARTRFGYVGPQARRLLGHPLDSWRREGFWQQQLHPDDRARAEEQCRAAAARGQDHELEYRMLAADGRVVWVRDIVSVVAGPGGPERLRGVMLDTTAEHAAALERQQLEEQMHRAQKLESVGVLAGGVAHDFNNLLVGILGNASLALERLPADHESRQLIRDVETTAQRAAELVKQLLAYAGKGDFELEACDLSDVVREVARLLGTAVSGRAELELALDERPLQIEGDVTQLRQVAMNLLLNASEALEGGAGAIRLRTGSVEVEPGLLQGCVLQAPALAGRCALLEVSDSGRGMDPPTIARIFEPFFSTRDPGRGLGLAAVLGIVRRHRGAIHLQSTPGRGSTIRVLLPLVERAPAARAAPEPAVAPWRGHGTILLADDERTVARVARAALEAAGFRVVSAADGAEALEVARKLDAELCAAVLDVTMPRIGGVEVLRRLRAARPGLPVLLMSGYAAQELAAKPALEGRVAFLQKPFRPRALVAELRRLLVPGEPDARSQDPDLAFLAASGRSSPSGRPGRA